MTNKQGLYQLITKLTTSGIKYEYLLPQDRIVLNPLDKPEKMSYPTWQFQLKLVSYFNQNGLCICGNQLTNIRELHHALLSRNDVKGADIEIRNLIHHTYNTFEICKNCHIGITREQSAVYLASLYGKENIIKWYNDFPLKTKVYRIEAYLD